MATLIDYINPLLAGIALTGANATDNMACAVGRMFQDTTLTGFFSQIAPQ